MFDKKIGIIGAGRLGTALLKNFKNKGCNVVGISSLAKNECELLARKLQVDFFDSNDTLVDVADILFFTVPDNKVVDVVTSSLKDYKKEKYFFHCSGAMSAIVIPKTDNVWRGTFHPLQSFANGTESIEGIYVALDGDKEAIEVAKSLCEILLANYLCIPSEDRALYHAAACIASNHLVTLLSLAQEIFARWTYTPKDAMKALSPLVEGSVRNWQKLGEKALTGPISRGDSKTIERHMSVLPKEMSAFYEVMNLYTLRLAEKNHSLSQEQVGNLRKSIQQKGEI